MHPKIQKYPCILVLSQVYTMQTVCNICWIFFCWEVYLKSNNYSTERK